MFTGFEDQQAAAPPPPAPIPDTSGYDERQIAIQSKIAQLQKTQEGVHPHYWIQGLKNQQAELAAESKGIDLQRRAEMNSARQAAQRVQQAEHQNRLRATDLAARGIPTYRDSQGGLGVATDETGAPLSHLDKSHGIAYDSKGEPKSLEYGAAGAVPGRPPAELAALIGFLWATGARISEALAVTPGSFDVEQSTVRLPTLKRRRKDGTGRLKTAARVVPLPPKYLAEVLAVIVRQRQTQTKLFDPEDDPALRPMDEVYAAKVAEINEAFEVSAAQLTAGYPPSEKITWPTQQDEALAWRASDLNPTPYIDALAAARGIGRVDFLGRVLLKVDAFRAASALIVGTRQRYVDVASAARDKGDVRAIDAIRPMFKLS
jgi:integrase